MICDKCYHNDAFKVKICGLCRNSMENPIRNRIAENLIKNTLVKCDNCDAMMKYARMQHHLETECQGVETECKYKPLGCKWIGPRRNLNDHQHFGIDYDSLITKFEETDTKISELRNSMKKTQIFKNLIINHNIFGTFDMKSIWQDFDIEDNHTHGYISRFCGNIRKRFRLQIVFMLEVDDSTPDDHYVDIRYKISVERFDHRLNSQLQISVVYADGEDTLDVVLAADETRIIDFGNSSKYESEWILLMSIEHGLSEANRHIQYSSDVGDIKIFAHLQ